MKDDARSELTAWLVPGFGIEGFGWAIVGALVLSVISLVDVAHWPEQG